MSQVLLGVRKAATDPGSLLCRTPQAGDRQLLDYSQKRIPFF